MKSSTYLLGMVAFVISHSVVASNIIRMPAPVTLQSAPSPEVTPPGEDNPDVTMPPISEAPSLYLDQVNLPNATQGAAYTFNFSPSRRWVGLESGQISPSLSWSIPSPAGFSINGSGVLSGVPNTLGSIILTVRLSGSGYDVSQYYTLQVVAPSCVNASTAANGTRSSSFCNRQGKSYIKYGSLLFDGNDNAALDWRAAGQFCSPGSLPTRSQLSSLINAHPSLFSPTGTKYYWTRDTYDLGRAYYVRLVNGKPETGGFLRSDITTRHIFRCVRNI